MSEPTKTLVPKLRFPEFLDVGEWKQSKLGERAVSIFVKERTPLQNLSLDNYVSTENLLPDFAGVINAAKLPPNGSFTRFKEGDVLISNIRPYLKKVWSANKNGASSNDVIVIRAQSSISDSFLTFLLKNDNFIDYIMKGAKGVKMPRGDISLMKEYPVAIPSPKEQQKIADCLSSIDELITAQTNKIAALKNHKKGLMQQLFPLEGETIPKLRFPEFQDAKEWVEKPLAKVCDVLQGFGFPEVLQGKNEGKYPFCKVSDISRAVAEKGGILSEATNYIGDDELLKLRAKLIPEGSTVFAKIGEALRLNRRAYVQKACLIDNNATGLKAIEGVALDYFVYLMSQLIDLNEYCGGAVPSVNKTTLEEIKVIVPKPEEQQKIADCLSSIDELIATQTQKLEAYKAHKIGLMQQLFPDTDKVSE